MMPADFSVEIKSLPITSSLLVTRHIAVADPKQRTLFLDALQLVTSVSEHVSRVSLFSPVLAKASINFRSIPVSFVKSMTAN